MTTAAPAPRTQVTLRSRIAGAARYLVMPLRVLVLLPAMLVGRTLLGRQGEANEPEHLVWNEADRLWEPANRHIELSVIMPFYNPGDALAPTVRRAHGSLTEAGIGFEIIAVSDGSTDGSEKTLEGMPAEVKVVILPANRGKGGALHAGFARARGSWLGFVDSDGDIDPAHLVDYVRVARRGGYDIVFANKKHGLSESASSPFRKLVSFGFSSIVGTLFSLGVNDTQTGCKLVRRDVMADLLPRMRETRFAFDLELFVAAVTAGYRDLRAQPVRLEERMSGSTVSKKTILRTLTDALSVLARRHYTDTYRISPIGSPGSATSDDLRLAA
jgi:glycosyltransferase involved in cell wall biosynthesis